MPEGVSTCGACLRRPPSFDGAIAAVDYGHPWDRLIARLKFNDGLDLVAGFADLLAAACDRHTFDATALLLPVPLSSARLRERGYNQSWEIARRLARLLGCPADPGLVLRIRDTPHQLSLPVDRRAANVKGAFAVEPRRRKELLARTVMLVDDVMTTGETMSELSRVLRQAGAAQVHALVLARTPTPGE